MQTQCCALPFYKHKVSRPYFETFVPTSGHCQHQGSGQLQWLHLFASSNQDTSCCEEPSFELVACGTALSYRPSTLVQACMLSDGKKDRTRSNHPNWEGPSTFQNRAHLHAEMSLSACPPPPLRNALGSLVPALLRPAESLSAAATSSA